MADSTGTVYIVVKVTLCTQDFTGSSILLADSLPLLTLICIPPVCRTPVQFRHIGLVGEIL